MRQAETFALKSNITDAAVVLALGMASVVPETGANDFIYVEDDGNFVSVVVLWIPLKVVILRIPLMPMHDHFQYLC